MRRLAKLGAAVIDGSVAVVAAVGGLAAGGLRKFAEHGDDAAPKTKTKAPAASDAG